MPKPNPIWPRVTFPPGHPQHGVELCYHPENPEEQSSNSAVLKDTSNVYGQMLIESQKAWNSYLLNQSNLSEEEKRLVRAEESRLSQIPLDTP